MFPERIICLSAESADICAKLGAGNRIVGVGAFAPRGLRQGRRVVGGFSTLKRDELLELAPDLVITFSDVQAEMSADLIRNHCTVLATNQRSLHRGNSAQILSSRWPAAFSAYALWHALFVAHVGVSRPVTAFAAGISGELLGRSLGPADRAFLEHRQYAVQRLTILVTYGEPSDVIELNTVSEAALGQEEVLVSMESAPLNPSGFMLVRGIYDVRPAFPFSLGSEG